MGFRVNPLSGAAAAGMALLSSLALAVAFGWNRILSGSADITYHLQMLDTVRGGGLVPPAAQAWLGENYGYPDVAHRLGAALTWFGLSDLNALTLFGCFSAALIWFCLFDQARRAGLVVLAGGLVLAFANAATARACFGAEVVSNFFYPQVAGEAFAVVALAALQPLLARSRTAYAGLAALAVLVCGCFHLIPTLHLAGAVTALLGAEALRTLLRQRRIDWPCLIGILAAAAAIVASPYFWALRGLASHDGVAGFGIEFSLIQLAAAEGLLLALCAWILIGQALATSPPGPAERAAALLAALGAAVALAGLAQFAAYQLLGEGSPYAVRKHAFAVGSLLCLAAPLWTAALARRLGPAPTWTLAITAGGQIALIAILFARPNVLDVTATDKLLADARALRLSRGQERTDILFASGQAPPLVSYIVGSAALRRKRDEASADVLAAGIPLDLTRVTRIATPVGDVYDKAECREGPPLRGLVVVKAACAALPAAVFKSGGNGAAYLTEGWGQPETGGVWTLGRWGVIDLPIPPEARRYRSPYVEITLFGFVPPQSPERRIWVTVGSEAPEPRTLLAFKRSRLTVEHPLTPTQMAQGELRIVFEIENPVSPASLGLGDDPRRLGLGLEQIRILPRVQ